MENLTQNQQEIVKALEVLHQAHPEKTTIEQLGLAYIVTLTLTTTMTWGDVDTTTWTYIISLDEFQLIYAEGYYS